MRYFVIDHFEDALAVLETPQGSFITLPKAWLPPESKEGDFLKVETALDLREIEAGPLNAVYLELDTDATEKKREQLRALRARLKKGPSGDLEL